MADRKAELERKKARLQQMREEKERRRKEKERLDAESAAQSLIGARNRSTSPSVSCESNQFGLWLSGAVVRSQCYNQSPLESGQIDPGSKPG